MSGDARAGGGTTTADMSYDEARALRERVAARLERHRARLEAHRAGLAASPSASQHSKGGGRVGEQARGGTGPAVLDTPGETTHYARDSRGTSQARESSASSGSLSFSAARDEADPSAGSTEPGGDDAGDGASGSEAIGTSRSERLAGLHRQAAAAERAAEAAEEAELLPSKAASRSRHAPGGQSGRGNGKRGSAGGGNVHSRSSAWLEARKERSAVLKEEADQREVAEVRDAPLIDKRSARLAEQRARRRDGGTGHVSDHLYADAERQRKHRAALQAQAEADELLGYPAITRQAAQLVRDEDVGERLYRNAAEIEQRRQAAVLQKEVDEMSALRSAASRARAASGSAGGPQSWNGEDRATARGNTLHRRAQEQKMRQEQRAVLAEEEVRRKMVPKLNKRSLAIAASLPESSKERLLAATKASAARQQAGSEVSLSSSMLDSASGALEPGVVASPASITESVAGEEGVKGGYRGSGRAEAHLTSAAMMAQAAAQRTKERVIARQTKAGERLYRAGKVRERKMALLKKKVDEEEVAECTFQPKLVAKPKVGAGHPRKEQRGDIFSRSQAWNRAKEAKIARAAHAAADKDLDGCTFRPAISRGPIDGRGGVDDGIHTGAREPLRPKATAAGALLGIGSSSMRAEEAKAAANGLGPDVAELERRARGVAAFVKRQQQARAAAEEKKVVPFADGSKWTGATTKPSSPKFSNRARAGGSKIRSLARPVGYAAKAAAALARAGRQTQTQRGDNGPERDSGGAGIGRGLSMPPPPPPESRTSDAALDPPSLHPAPPARRRIEDDSGYATAAAAPPAVPQRKPAGASLRDELAAQVAALASAGDDGADGANYGDDDEEEGGYWEREDLEARRVPLPDERRAGGATRWQDTYEAGSADDSWAGVDASRYSAALGDRSAYYGAHDDDLAEGVPYTVLAAEAEARAAADEIRRAGTTVRLGP